MITRGFTRQLLVFIVHLCIIRVTAVVITHVPMYNCGITAVIVAIITIVTAFISDTDTQRVIVISRLMLLVLCPI